MGSVIKYSVWLEAPFEEGRHTLRINAIMKRRKMG
jgi:hypothetical protein